MARAEYTVGPDIDATRLAAYRELLDRAYANGEERGGSMDWGDIQAALEKAVEGLGGEARRFIEDTAADDGVEDGVKLVFADGSDITDDAWSACLLLLAYRFPDAVEWEDIDAAWEALHREPKAAARP